MDGEGRGYGNEVGEDQDLDMMEGDEVSDGSELSAGMRPMALRSMTRWTRFLRLGCCETDLAV